MINMEPATIIILCPKKLADPTEYTWQWAQKAIKIATDLGYNVKILEKDDVTYNNVTEAIKKYNPRMLVTFSHGCPLSILGQKECVITRKYSISQLIEMAESNNIEDREQLKRLITPVRTSFCLEGVCKLENDTCSPICLKDTNIHLLKNTIVVAIACHTASKLGQCAIRYGVETYIGYEDLMMFSADTLGSHNLFRDVHTEFIRELLLGHSVRDAEHRMNILEDNLIRRYKRIKYVALPLLWNKRNRRILGNQDARIYE